jgi:hypothetical protein
MSRRLRSLAASLLVLLPAVAAAQPPEEKAPVPILARDGVLMETGYLSTPLTLGEGVRARSITLSHASGKYKVTLLLDPNQKLLDDFGEVRETTTLGVKKVEATLRARNAADPKRLGRKLYDVESDKLDARLTLVVPEREDGQHLLLLRDKNGRVESVFPLGIKRPELRLQPCHPGCFPAGTLVETPNGLRKIETIKPDEEVFDVPTKGKPVAVKVASVFTGPSLLVEVETEAGKLVTTGKQPLLLANGDQKGAGDLVKGDAILRWHDGKAVSVKVRAVRRIEEPARVFNLVLERRGTFVAGGYLVRSKPPAE